MLMKNWILARIVSTMLALSSPCMHLYRTQLVMQVVCATRYRHLIYREGPSLFISHKNTPFPLIFG